MSRFKNKFTTRIAFRLGRFYFLAHAHMLVNNHNHVVRNFWTIFIFQSTQHNVLHYEPYFAYCGIFLMKNCKIYRNVSDRKSHFTLLLCFKNIKSCNENTIYRYLDLKILVVFLFFYRNVNCISCWLINLVK